jgi:SAM-dependent methyltransferase
MADPQELIGGIKLPSGKITPARRSSRSLRKRNAIVACSFELKGKRVLDIGCADGLHSMYMAATALEVRGVDHRSSQIAIGKATAKALGISNVRLDCGDVRDPKLFEGGGKFDLAIAWGFLHRVTDIFSLLYSVEPLADALSFEWRTPVLPMMSTLSVAYHPSGGKALDPMNTTNGTDGRATVADKEKIEGQTAFWEPTPGAVAAIARRLGYVHGTLLGYGDDFDTESETIAQCWQKQMSAINAGKARMDKLPQARVHMLFEKKKGSISIKGLGSGEYRIPQWDQAMLKALRR